MLEIGNYTFLRLLHDLGGKKKKNYAAIKELLFDFCISEELIWICPSINACFLVYANELIFKNASAFFVYLSKFLCYI